MSSRRKEDMDFNPQKERPGNFDEVMNKIIQLERTREGRGDRKEEEHFENIMNSVKLMAEGADIIENKPLKIFCDENGCENWKKDYFVELLEELRKWGII